MEEKTEQLKLNQTEVVSAQNKEKKSKGKSHNKVKKIFVPIEKTVSIPSNSGDMVVVTKAKDLVKYIFQVTANMPKKIRFSFISKLQSLALALIDNLYRAAQIPYNKKTQSSIERKVYFLTEAKVSLKLIEYFSMLMVELGFFEIRHYKQIAQMGVKCETLTNNWLKKFDV